VTGYYSTSSTGAYLPITPTRIVDTRESGAPLKPNDPMEVGLLAPDLTGQEAIAFVVNITATNTDGTGFIAAYPSNLNMPNVSNLNYTPGVTVANMAQVAPGGGDSEFDGDVAFANEGASAGNVDLLIDEFGLYSSY
jgi:hypothetical protein